MAVPDPGIAIDLALQGLGIVVAPDLYCAPHLVSGRLTRLLPDHHRGERPVHAVYPSRRQLTPKVRAFVDFAAESIGVVLHEQAGGKSGEDRSIGPGVGGSIGSATSTSLARPKSVKAGRSGGAEALGERTGKRKVVALANPHKPGRHGANIAPSRRSAKDTVK